MRLSANRPHSPSRQGSRLSLPILGLRRGKPLAEICDGDFDDFTAELAIAQPVIPGEALRYAHTLAITLKHANVYAHIKTIMVVSD